MYWRNGKLKTHKTEQEPRKIIYDDDDDTMDNKNAELLKITDYVVIGHMESPSTFRLLPGLKQLLNTFFNS